MPQQFARVAARFGFTAAAHRLFYCLIQRVMILDVTYLMVIDGEQVSPGEEAHETLTFGFLDGDQLQRFAPDPRNQLESNLAKRLKSGRDFCFAALDQGRLASYCWLALDSIEAVHNRGARFESGVGLSFSQNATFIYKGFTHPDFRGGGIYPQLIQRAAMAMHDRGVRYILSTTDWTNFSALRGCRRSGKAKIGMIWRFGWGKWMKTIARQPRFGQLSVRIGGSARVTPRVLAPGYVASHAQ